MRLGVCGMTERIESAAKAGCDFIEPGFWKIASLSQEEFDEFDDKCRENNLGVDCMNCFLPGNVKVVGSNKDFDAAEKIIEKGVERAKKLGTKKVIFGSSGARNIPDGESYSNGVRDMYDFVKHTVSPLMRQGDMILCFEPLCRRETNFINTIKEGCMMSSFIDEDNVFCLADLYHCYIEGDTADDIRQLKGLIKHAHISNPIPAKMQDKRDYMKDINEFNYKEFVDAIIDAGCDTLSIEAHTDDFDKDIFPAMSVLKQLVK